MSSRWISISLSARCRLPRTIVDRGMHRLDQRRLAHAARAPEQRIVGRQAAREALGILHQRVAHAVDALEQRHLHAVDARDRNQPRALGMPDEGVGAAEIGHCGWTRREPLQRVGDARKRLVIGSRTWLGAGPRTRPFPGDVGFRIGGQSGSAWYPLAGPERPRKTAGIRACRGTAQRCNWAHRRYSPRRFRARKIAPNDDQEARWMLITPAYAQAPEAVTAAC